MMLIGALQHALLMLDPSANPSTSDGSGNGGGVEIPDPGFGHQPPGTQGLITALSWVAWGVGGLAVLGFLLVGARLTMHWRRQETGEHVVALGSVMLGCVIAGSASTIVLALR